MEVSIFAAHPLILERMRLQLRGAEFQVHAFLVPDVSQAERVALLPGSAYAVDAHLPELLERLLLRLPARARVVAVGEDFERHRAFALMLQGVRGLVRYADLSHDLARALRAVASGAYWVPRLLLAAFVDELLTQLPLGGRAAATLRVSARERQVLDGILTQRSNKEIAVAIGISERTVKFHVSNLLRRYGVAGRHALMLQVLRRGGDAGTLPPSLPQSGCQ
ncbi:MAG: LuxR C-terminal-related transcriptional regulator [Terriglobales bacterium]